MKKTQASYLIRICSHKLLWSLIIFAGYFILNLNLTSPVNVGYADSDELLTVAYSQGIAHPPGYPLYTWLLSLIVHSSIPGTIAFKGHLLSNIFSSLTLVFVLLTSFRLHDLIPKAPKSFTLLHPSFERLFLGLLTTLTLAFSFQFLLYAHIAEKYALGAFFVAVSLYQLIQLSSTERPGPSQWTILWLTLGLGLSHLQTFLLIAPAVIYLFHAKFKNNLSSQIPKALLLTLISFFLPYLYVLNVATRTPVVSWSFEHSYAGLLKLITRQDFTSTKYDVNQELSAYIPPLDINNNIQSAIEYFKLISFHVGFWLIPLLLLALKFGLLRSKIPSRLIGLSFLFLGVFLAAYIGIPQDWGSKGITLRQFIPGFVSLALFTFYGWWEIVHRLGSAFSILFKPVYVSIIAILFPLILTLPRISPLLSAADLSSYDLISRRYQYMLTQFDSNALVTCYSDTSCFALMYELYVNNQRPDLTLIPIAYPLTQAYNEEQNLQAFAYTQNPYRIVDIVTHNIDTRPIYAVELNDTFYNLFGIMRPFMYYIPEGDYGQLSFDVPSRLPNPKFHLVSEWLRQPVSPLDPMRLFHKSTLGRDHILNGTLYLKMDHRSWALEEFNQASNIFFQFTSKDQQEFTGLRNNLENFQPDPNFYPGSTIPSADTLLSLAKQYLENNQLGQSLLFVQAALNRDPNNIEARLLIADLYKQFGDPQFSQLEYQNALHIDPTNATASSNLESKPPTSAL